MLTNTLTKKSLENIIKEFFSKFGSFYSCLMLDSLKFLGFYYATKAGLSITIEDLKTPDSKKDILNQSNEYIDLISREWYQGKLSEAERFQSIIDQWNFATESLKNKIVDYYQLFDPVNNLYIMAFSGARGNMSQVRQLIGMRGLMSDQEGNIIDLPIQSNFREGLSSLDYLISAYGARKGVVDTALKTADSGYLTRRLIYVAQDLVIREIDCKTKNGVYIDFSRNSNGSNLIGRYLLSCFEHNKIFADLLDKAIDQESLQRLQKQKNLKVKIRSCLTCSSPSSLCQKCYGWDLSKFQIISLGEAVGIIAAQSIGEPGTQLTMRTFHTGGIFTSELLEQNLAPFSGKLIFPESLRLIKCRTNHGVIAHKIQQETKIKVINWQGKEKTLTVPFGSLLYKIKATFVKKGELISEASSDSAKLSLKRLKAIYSPIQGQIHFDKLTISTTRFKGLKHCDKEGTLYIHSGKLFHFPSESQLNFNKENFLISNKKSISKIKIITPYSGILKLDKTKVSIFQQKEKKEIYLEKFEFAKINQNNIKIRLNTIWKNNQFADISSLIAYIYLTPKESLKIYKFKSFYKRYELFFFFVAQDDIWRISLDELRTKYSDLKINSILTSNTKITQNLKTRESGILLKKDGLNLTFQKVYPIFLNKGTIISYKNGDFIYEKDHLASLISYRQQNEDIVQGLPKVEDLIESRSPSNPKFLVAYPSIILKFAEDESKESPIRYGRTRICSAQKRTKIRLANKNYARKFFLKLIGSRTKPEKIVAKYDNYIPPLNCVVVFGSHIVKRNRRKNYIAKTLGFSRKVLHLKRSHKHMSFVNLTKGITDGSIDMHDLIKCLNYFYKGKLGVVNGTIYGLHKFQLILANSIQAIYTSQGVDISNKHIEVIARQMTSKAKILSCSHKLPFYKKEIVRLSLILEIAKAFNKKTSSRRVNFESVVLSSTATSLTKNGFLAAAGFQETKRVLSRAALEGHKDWLKGLKECIITGRLIPAGSAFLNYKNYLDTIYSYKNINPLDKEGENLKFQEILEKNQSSNTFSEKDKEAKENLTKKLQNFLNKEII